MEELPDQPVEVTEDIHAQRFDLRVGQAVVGQAAYRLSPGRVVFVHTEIDPAYRGRGLGQRLAAEALARMRERGLEIDATCWFMAAELRRT